MAICNKLGFCTHADIYTKSIFTFLFPIFLALYSKAKGQYLRLALPLHALSQPRPLPVLIPTEISEAVQKASIHMVSLCIEHTALLAGRDVKEGIIQTPQETSTTATPQSSNEKLEQLILTFPGNHISATKMNNLSKFRRDGGKQKVLMIFNSLESKRLGTISHGKNNVSDKIKMYLSQLHMHMNDQT